MTAHHVSAALEPYSVFPAPPVQHGFHHLLESAQLLLLQTGGRAHVAGAGIHIQQLQTNGVSQHCLRSLIIPVL